MNVISLARVQLNFHVLTAKKQMTSFFEASPVCRMDWHTSEAAIRIEKEGFVTWTPWSNVKHAIEMSLASAPELDTTVPGSVVPVEELPLREQFDRKTKGPRRKRDGHEPE